MAALETKAAMWYAQFRDLHYKIVCKRIEIVRTKWDHDTAPYYWTVINDVGVWPGTDSDEWIEVVW